MKFYFKNIDIDVTPHSFGHWILSADFGKLKVTSITTDSELIDRVYYDSDERAWHIIKDALWNKFAFCNYTFNNILDCCDSFDKFNILIDHLLSLSWGISFKKYSKSDDADFWDYLTTLLDVEYDQVTAIYCEPEAQIFIAFSGDYLY